MIRLGRILQPRRLQRVAFPADDMYVPCVPPEPATHQFDKVTKVKVDSASCASAPPAAHPAAASRTMALKIGGWGTMVGVAFLAVMTIPRWTSPFASRAATMVRFVYNPWPLNKRS